MNYPITMAPELVVIYMEWQYWSTRALYFANIAGKEPSSEYYFQEANRQCSSLQAKFHCAMTRIAYDMETKQ